MIPKYNKDWIDGHEAPPLVIKENYILVGNHKGSVIIEKGVFALEGILNGSLDVQKGVTVSIIGTQNGSVNINQGAKVIVSGTINGSTYVHQNAILIIENGGKLVGSLSNSGKVMLRGVFGGSQSGRGELIIEENGFIKQPKIRNGVSYYEW